MKVGRTTEQQNLSTQIKHTPEMEPVRIENSSDGINVLTDRQLSSYGVPKRPDTAKLLKHIKAHGLSDTEAVLQETFDQWRDAPLNVAILGPAGTGKSSLINSLRNIPDNHPSAARVGVNDTTKDCKPYPHPKYKTVVLWDVPVTKFVQFDIYDFFLICSVGRFTKYSELLVSEIETRGKRFYLIRTKIDFDMMNEQRRLKEGFNEKYLTDSVREYCENSLNIVEDNVFLISNAYSTIYDFPKLVSKLDADFKFEKKAAFLLSLFGDSGNAITGVEQAKMLQSRVWKVVLASSFGAVVPIPWLSTNVDISIILQEILFYREQLGLSEESLAKMANIAGGDIITLKRAIQFKTPASIYTGEGLSSYLMEQDKQETDAHDTSMTMFGGLQGWGQSTYYTKSNTLKHILNMMQEDAENVLKYVINTHTIYV